MRITESNGYIRCRKVIKGKREDFKVKISKKCPKDAARMTAQRKMTEKVEKKDSNLILSFSFSFEKIHSLRTV